MVVVGLGLAMAAAGCGKSSARASPQITFSPAAGTPVASPQTQISVLGASVERLRNITVTGTRSGRHAGRLVAHRVGTGATFIPYERFDPGESVQVSVRLAGRKGTVRDRFAIAHPVPLAGPGGSPGRPTRPGQVQKFRSRPDLRPPTVSVTAQANGTAPGDIFLSPTYKLGQAGRLLLDSRGRTVWFHPLSGKTQAFNFREQRYQNKPVLTWWQGLVVGHGYGDGEDMIYNSSYRRIATVRATDGYRADIHDFVITPQGTALLIAYNPVRADLSSVGGPRDGTVMDCVVQEVDIQTGLIL